MKTMMIIILNFAKVCSDDIENFKENLELYFGRRIMRPDAQQKNCNTIVINEEVSREDKRYIEGIKPDGSSLVYLYVESEEDLGNEDWTDLIPSAPVDIIKEP